MYSTLLYPEKTLSLILSFLCLTCLTVQAQFSLSTNKTTADYALNETARIGILSDESGTVDYSFFYSNATPVISSGSIELSGGELTEIEFTSTEPGLIWCAVTLNNTTKNIALTFDRERIFAQEEAPDDFWEFWATQVQNARDIPLDVQIDFDSAEDDVTNYSLSIAGLDNRRMYGYLSIPNTGDNFPAFVMLPAFGSGAGQISPPDFEADRTNSMILSLSIHNAEPEEADPNAYSPQNSTNREEYYYRYAILGTVRMIDYLFTRPEFDGESLGVMGVSQGAGLSTIIAGLDNRIKLLAMSNPALCHHVGFEYGRAAGFPKYLQSALPADYNQTLTASKYYDAAYFAEQYAGPTLINISYLDDITPAETSFAAINKLRGEVILSHSLQLGHNHPSSYWNGRFDFFRRNFPSTTIEPFFVNKGYWLEVNAPETSPTNENIALEAVFMDDEDIINLPTRWIQLAGQGEAVFSNPNTAATTVSFNQPGQYLLKVIATDTTLLEEDATFFTLSKQIQINVTGEGGGNNCMGFSSINNIENISCNGLSDGSVSLEITGGTAPYTYTWSNGENTATIAELPAGAYGLTVYDANNCTITDRLTIEEPEPLSLTLSDITTIECTGQSTGAASLVATGGTQAYNFSWSDGGTGASREALPAGNYTVTLSDANACETMTSFEITVNPDETPPTIECPTVYTVDCVGLVDYTVSAEDFCGIESYTYSHPPGSVFAEGLTEVLVSVVDVNGNEANCTFEVEVSTFTGADIIVNHVSCYGENDGALHIAPVGGVAPYEIEIDGGNLEELSAGTYDILITDAMGCTVSAGATIEEPNPLSVLVTQITAQNQNNQNGAISIDITGGIPPYFYTWQGPDDFSANTEDLSNLTAGDYTLTLIDNNGCQEISAPISVSLLSSLLQNEYDKAIRLFPNPVSDILYVEMDDLSSDVVHLLLYNSLGQLLPISPHTASPNSISLNMKELPSGTYWLEISVKGQILTKKIIK